MADRQITCVSKTGRSHEAITGAGGQIFWQPVDQIIRNIESRTDTYFTTAGGKRAEVRVVQGSTKRYIRTQADGIPNDNLLQLPACPGR